MIKIRRIRKELKITTGKFQKFFTVYWYLLTNITQNNKIRKSKKKSDNMCLYLLLCVCMHAYVCMFMYLYVYLFLYMSLKKYVKINYCLFFTPHIANEMQRFFHFFVKHNHTQTHQKSLHKTNQNNRMIHTHTRTTTKRWQRETYADTNSHKTNASHKSMFAWRFCHFLFRFMTTIVFFFLCAVVYVIVYVIECLSL